MSLNLFPRSASEGGSPTFTFRRLRSAVVFLLAAFAPRPLHAQQPDPLTDEEIAALREVIVDLLSERFTDTTLVTFSLDSALTPRLPIAAEALLPPDDPLVRIRDCPALSREGTCSVGPNRALVFVRSVSSGSLPEQTARDAKVAPGTPFVEVDLEFRYWVGWPSSEGATYLVVSDEEGPRIILIRMWIT